MSHRTMWSMLWCVLMILGTCCQQPVWGGMTLSSVSLDARVEPVERKLFVRADIIFALSEKGDASFLLNPALVVSRALLDGADQVPSAFQQGRLMLAGLAPGSHSLALWYSGEFPDEVARTSGITVRHDLVSLKDSAWWHPAVPLVQAFGWSLRLDLPRHLRAMASGQCLSRRIEGEREISRWQCDRVRNGGLVVAARFQQLQAMCEGIPIILAWSNPKFQGGQRLLRYAVDLVRLFQRMYGPWPFPALTIVEDPTMPSKNGRGASGMVILASNALDLTLYSTCDGATGFLAHEVSHSYWMGLISAVPGSTDWLDFNLFTEGMAHYSALRYLETVGSAAFDPFLTHLVGHWEQFPAPHPTKFRSINRETPKMSIIAKCGIFLWSLRRTIGPALFDQRLRDLIRQKRWQLLDREQFFEAVAHTGDPRIATYVEQWLDSTDLTPAGEPLPALSPATIDRRPGMR